MSFVTWWYPVVAWGVVLAALSGTAARVVPGRVPGWVPAAVGLLAFVPFAGLPLGRWLHGLGMSFSVPLVVVFVDFALRSVGAAALLDSAARRAAAWFGMIAGLLLYPGALGLGSFDPYVLGWRWPGVAAGACATAAGLAIAGNRFAIVLVGTAVAWHAGMLESDNAWDYLVDPVYAVLSAVNLVGAGLVAVLRRSPVPLALCAVLGVAPTASGAEPNVSRATLDEIWAAAAADLERRADRADHREFAALVRDWTVPPEPGRQQVFRVPARLDVPTWIDTADEEAMWRDFIAARKARAAGLFRLAVEAAQAHADVPTRAERAAGRPAPLPQRGCEALELLYAALRDDPDHARAREAGGWVRRDGTWIWPEVARRLDAGEIHDVARGWGPRSRSGRDQPRRTDAPVTWNSDHWKITSPAGVDAAAALATELELAHDVWRQAFGAFALEPADLERAFEGRGRPVPHGPFAATLFADRATYVGALEKLEPTIARTLGVYWTPTRTAYFFPARGTAGDDGEPNAATIHHEATHQLFAEMRKTSPLAGERAGFWALEAAACYVESLRPTAYGWTLGGRDAGRGPAARERLVEDGFHVPLAELCALGRAQLQADERLPAIYSQISGLADFFMNGERGRHREAFVEYLVRVFTGSVSADSLARLCGMSYEELDDAYRRHMAH